MRREISSSVTGFYKVSVLLLFAVIIAAGLFENLVRPETFGILFCSLSMIAGFFIVRWALNWKKVEISEKGIFVYNADFFNDTEIFVPFDQIESAGQSYWTRGSPELVSIRFSAPTPFGDKIWFVPKTRFFPLFAHPVVDEINRLADGGKGFIT